MLIASTSYCTKIFFARLSNQAQSNQKHFWGLNLAEVDSLLKFSLKMLFPDTCIYASVAVH